MLHNAKVIIEQHWLSRQTNTGWVNTHTHKHPCTHTHARTPACMHTQRTTKCIHKCMHALTHRRTQTHTHSAHTHPCSYQQTHPHTDKQTEIDRYGKHMQSRTHTCTHTPIQTLGMHRTKNAASSVPQNERYRCVLQPNDALFPHHSVLELGISGVNEPSAPAPL